MRVFSKALIIPAALALAACGGSDTTAPSNSPPVATNAISVGNDFFTPNNVVVPVGSTVTWTWTANASAHNVTFSDGTSGDRSGGGTPYTRTFPTAGTFNFHCTIHPSMTGSVTVQ